MSAIPDPEEVLSKGEIRRLRRSIRWYENPLKPFAFGAALTFLGSIAVIIALVQLGVDFSPPEPGGYTAEIFWWSVGVGIATGFFARTAAPYRFADFDRRYFNRAGITEEEYLDSLRQHTKRMAAVAFTEMPDGTHETMLDHPEADQRTAFKAYQDRCVRECEEGEAQLAFKAYVARYFGLDVPLKGENIFTRY